MVIAKWIEAYKNLSAQPGQGTRRRSAMKTLRLKEEMAIPRLIMTVSLLFAVLLSSTSHAANGKELMKAAFNNDVLTVKALLDKGIDVNTPSEDGATALMAASQNGHLEIVSTLLNKGAAVNVRAKDGSTALLLSAMKGHSNVVKALIASAADVNVRARRGWTPLMLASQNGHSEVVRMLLEKGSDKNAKNDDGGTPLILASQNGHIEVVKILLDQGADVNIKGNYGTALMVASKRGHAEIVQLLKKTPGPEQTTSKRPESIGQKDLERSVKWVTMTQQFLPEGPYGIDADGNLATKDNKDIPYQAVKIGRDNDNRVAFFMITTVLKSIGKNKYGEFLFPMEPKQEITDLVQITNDDNTLVFYRQKGVPVTDLHKQMIGQLLRIGDLNSINQWCPI